MLRLKLIIIGIVLSLGVVYSSPTVISPVITISNVTSTSFTLNWSSPIITGLNEGSSYNLTYNVIVTGPGGSSMTTFTNGTTFKNLQPSSSYTIWLHTTAWILGELTTVNVPSVAAFITTKNEPILDVNTVSTDYTQQSSKSVILKAKTRIILTTGFHYKAAEGYSLVTQLLPNAKSSNTVENDILNPEYCCLDIDKQPTNSTDGQIVPEYEVMRPQQGPLLIRNKGFDYNVVKSRYYEIIEMNTGRISKQGNLSGYETQIEVSDLKGGFYVVRVTDGEQMYSQKITIRN